MLGTHPLDGLIGDVGAAVVIGVGVQIHPVHVVVDDRMKQVSLASHEAVEPLKPAMQGPAIERTDSAGFPGPQLVTLAEHGGAVTVQPQDIGQHRDAGGTHRGVSRERGGNFGDHAEVCAMAVAAGEQSHPAGRTQRGHFEIVVTQPGLGEAVQRRHLDRTAERRTVAEAEVVEKNDHHIGRAFRRLHLEPWRSCCIVHIKLGDRRVLRLGHGKHGTVHGRAAR